MPSNTGRESPLVFAPNVESEEWIKEWETVQAKGAWIPSSVVKFGANFEPRDLVDGPLIVYRRRNIRRRRLCGKLLHAKSQRGLQLTETSSNARRRSFPNNTDCLAVKTAETTAESIVGLFDVSTHAVQGASYFRTE